MELVLLAPTLRQYAPSVARSSATECHPPELLTAPEPQSISVRVSDGVNGRCVPLVKKQIAEVAPSFLPGKTVAS